MTINKKSTIIYALFFLVLLLSTLIIIISNHNNKIDKSVNTDLPTNSKVIDDRILGLKIDILNANDKTIEQGYWKTNAITNPSNISVTIFDKIFTDNTRNSNNLYFSISKYLYEENTIDSIESIMSKEEFFQSHNGLVIKDESLGLIFKQETENIPYFISEGTKFFKINARHKWESDENRNDQFAIVYNNNFPGKYYYISYKYVDPDITIEFKNDPDRYLYVDINEEELSRLKPLNSEIKTRDRDTLYHNSFYIETPEINGNYVFHQVNILDGNDKYKLSDEFKNSFYNFLPNINNLPSKSNSIIADNNEIPIENDTEYIVLQDDNIEIQELWDTINIYKGKISNIVKLDLYKTIPSIHILCFDKKDNVLYLDRNYNGISESKLYRIDIDEENYTTYINDIENYIYMGDVTCAERIL